VPLSGPAWKGSALNLAILGEGAPRSAFYNVPRVGLPGWMFRIATRERHAQLTTARIGADPRLARRQMHTFKAGQ
jgi:hypothetical protein